MKKVDSSFHVLYNSKIIKIKPKILPSLTHGGGIKKPVLTFSQRSRFYLLNFLGSLFFPLRLHLWTGTVPHDIDISNFQIKKIFKYFRYKIPYDFPFIWKLEFQGGKYPHYHILFIDYKGILNKDENYFRFRDILEYNWTQSIFHIIGFDFKYHDIYEKSLKVGSNLSSEEYKNTQFSYFTYQAEHKQDQLPADEISWSGRFWGLGNRDKFIYDDYTYIPVPVDFYNIINDRLNSDDFDGQLFFCLTENNEVKYNEVIELLEIFRKEHMDLFYINPKKSHAKVAWRDQYFIESVSI